MKPLFLRGYHAVDHARIPSLPGQAPVLAKRKTKFMREAEGAKKKAKEERKVAALKHAQLDRQFYIPDHRDMDPEKQLRRVATRGGE